MCDVGTAVSTIGLGLQGASVIGSYISEKQTASAYSDYHALQTQSTLNNYIQQTKALQKKHYLLFVTKSNLNRYNEPFWTLY